MADKYESLKLDNQLCFPLYAVSKEIVRRYKPHLDKLDLTYTQYITMMVMWENSSITTKEMGKLLMLDSGTLTPVLKKLEAKGYVTRARDAGDERNLVVTVTEDGMALREKALDVPRNMSTCIHLSDDEAKQLWGILGKLLSNWDEEE